MKKILLGLLITALVLGLTSCAPESYKEMAEKMGKMSENVYGITANMAEVDNATAAVSASVAVQKDENGAVTGATIDFAAAAKITESVASIKDSEQKTEALKTELAKPVVDTSSMSETEAAAQNKAVKDAMEAQTAALAATVQATIDAAPAEGAEEAVALLTTVKNTIESIQASISAEPTMAELSTIAVLTEMATTVQEVAAAAVDPTQQDKYVTEEGLTEEGLKVADTALSSLDTLKMTSEVAGMNLLGDVDIMDLMSSLTGGGSKGINPEVQPYLVAFKAPVATITSLITTEREVEGKKLYFDEDKYNSLVAQARAIKMSYDLLSALYVKPASIEDIDAVLSKKMNHGLVVDDLVRYIVALTFVSIDDAKGKDALGEFINATGIYDALMDIGNAEKLEAFNGAEAPDGFGTIWTNIQVSFVQMTENGPVMTENGPALTQYALRSLSTLAILIVDTGYKDILSLGGGDGKVSTYFGKILGN